MNSEELSSEQPPRQPSPAGVEGIGSPELSALTPNKDQPFVGGAAWTPPTPEELSRLLPEFCVEALLGRGGMGAVYKGRQIALDRPVAIKLLPAEVAANERFVTHFRREARILAKLQHPGIVNVYDFGQTSKGHLYFVMEFVDGTDLRHILLGPGLKPAQALELISQVCDALHYAHTKGVIHRDIKPGNILVTSEGRAKLADFGLAQPITGESSVLTGTSALMGTVEYMAPEQQDGHADQRADIYALGVMLYEMLTGQRPSGVFDPPSRRVQVDIRLDGVVLKALQNEPDRRYQQVSEMKTDVDRIRTTPSESIPTPAKAAPLRNGLLLAAAMVASCAVIAGMVLWEKYGSSAARKIAARKTDSFAAEPRAATMDRPFVNTLGMKFVPVPITPGGQPVLFSMWETRVQDYAVFAAETGREWTKPDFEQGPTHPAVLVTWNDAQAFCLWLTERERQSGKIGPGERYRLPGDPEWSYATGVDSSAHRFLWGNEWPPPPGSGNFGDQTAKSRNASSPARGSSPATFIDGFDDGYAWTSPVGSFKPNSLGLYDLFGNVTEWCDEAFERYPTRHILRGGNWGDDDEHYIRLSARAGYPADGKLDIYGFRCVLELVPSSADEKSRVNQP